MHRRSSALVLVLLFASPAFADFSGRVVGVTDGDTIKDITVLFSPTSVTGESIRDETIRRIGSTTKTLDIAIYTFTEPSLAQAILEAKERGVSIRIILDVGQSRQKTSQLGTLTMPGLPIKLLTGIKGNGIMHHKIAIYDAQVVQTGSFNWTNNASCCSWENALFISDAEVVKRYQAAFEQMWGVGP